MLDFLIPVPQLLFELLGILRTHHKFLFQWHHLGLEQFNLFITLGNGFFRGP